MRKYDNTNGSDQLKITKQKIINTIYIIFGILAIPLAAASISRTSVTGWIWIYTYYIVIAIIPVVILLFLHRVPYQTKVYTALVILISNAIFGTISFGVLSHGRMFIILVIVLAGLLLNKQQGYYFLIFNTAVLIVLTLLFIRHEILPEQSTKTEGNHTRKDGSEFPVEISISTIELDNGKHILGFARDITERKKAEKALLESEEKYKKLVESFPDIILLSDLEGNIIYGNENVSSKLETAIQKVMEDRYYFPEDISLKAMKS